MPKKLIFFIALITKVAAAQQICPVIPKPASAAIINSGYFVFNKSTILINETSRDALSGFFNTELKTRMMSKGKISNKKNANAIVLLKLDNSLANETYQLSVQPNRIEIKAGGQAGVFYGLVSLLQMIDLGEATKEGGIKISCWSIEDHPRYQWRGFMLDEARHFFGVAKVKQILNWMAYYKLNRFHWHLTDAQGWRIAIDAYPKLAEIGGIGNFSDPKASAKYYSKADIKEIIVYAKERNIEIIPEIDMPGHATAANKAYPEFNGGGSDEYPNFTFNPGIEKTYTYLNSIIKEVDDLFPSNMIHLGGDEVSFGAQAWETDQHVIKLKKDQKLNNIQEVEHYFFRRMADSVYKSGNKVLAWDEVADSGIPTKSSLLFWWRQDKTQQLEKALNKGYHVVLCPRLPMYFDFVQDSSHTLGRKWNKQFNSLSKVYNFPKGNKLYNDSLVVGVQSNLWSETIFDKSRLDYMLFPRIAALAEAGWTSEENKNYTDFCAILKKHLNLYDKDGIKYYNPFYPQNTKEKNKNQ